MAASIKSVCLSLLRKPCVYSHPRRNIFNNRRLSHVKNFSTTQKNDPKQSCGLTKDTTNVLLQPSLSSSFCNRDVLCRLCSTEVEVADPEELDVLYSKIVLEVKGHDPAVLKSYKTFVCRAAKHLEIELAVVRNPKVHIFRQSLLGSVHIYKKHQVQYEQRTHFRILELIHLTGSTADTFLEYIQRNLPEGTAMKVTRHRIEAIPKHLKPPQKKGNEIEAKGNQIES